MREKCRPTLDAASTSPLVRDEDHDDSNRRTSVSLPLAKQPVYGLPCQVIIDIFSVVLLIELAE